MNDKIWDVVIVGGGPAGCSAAIVLARSNRRVIIIDEGHQRNIRSHGMRNYLTRDGIIPPEYLNHAHKELEGYGIELVNSRVTQAQKLADKGFKLTDKDNNTYLCRRVLLATGVSDNVPDIPGFYEGWGTSVFHCPFCDGWECKDKTIGLYANKINGYGMTLLLRQLSCNIILFTDGAKYLRPKQKVHLESCKIDVVSKKLERLVYDDSNHMTHVALQNGEQIPCDVMFVNHGHKVNDELLKQLGCNCTKKGAALTNRKQQTSISGVYVAGDASYDMHFVIVAAAEGTKAAVAIHNDLLTTDNLRF
ncbi:MAG: NAD(P)/FAD-dependent oxidoreductase [Sphingobacteriales bacterium]|nr:MAG: NAD(P)/FAD-dependent oxidoreductase [Sphingobacteriales bacterium]